jgi:hypothetical protein
LARIGEALGRNDVTFDIAFETVQLWLEKYGQKTVSEVLLQVVQAFVPSGGPEAYIAPEQATVYVADTNTRTKAKAILLKLPEPNPAWLAAVLSVINDLLPRLRHLLLPFVKALPGAHGGRPRKWPDPDTRQAIRNEIGRLLADGWKLSPAQEHVTTLPQFKALELKKSMVEKIWQENRKGSKNDGDTM